MFFIFTIIRAGGEDSAFSNASIIHQLREQVSQLQAIVQEKEENEKAAAQKLAMYQNQLHGKNNEVATLKDQLQAQVVLNIAASGDTLHDTYTGRPRPKGGGGAFSGLGYMYRVKISWS